MDYLDIKINKKYLNKLLRLNSDKEYAMEAEAYGRACLYLDREKEAIESFGIASWLENENFLAIKKNGGDFYDMLYGYLTKANCLRLANRGEESKELFLEIKSKLEEYLTTIKDRELIKKCNKRYIGILFILGLYKECIKEEEKLKINFPQVKGESHPKTMSIGILNKDKKMIGKTIRNIIRDAKEMKIGPGEDTSLGVTIWDWYEMCLMILGLPSRQDYMEWKPSKIN